MQFLMVHVLEHALKVLFCFVNYVNHLGQPNNCSGRREAPEDDECFGEGQDNFTS